jgi:hypothetical protein
MSRYKDITGQRFAKLVAVSHCGTHKNNSALWLCRCDCGEDRIVALSRLHNAQIVSCKSCSRKKIGDAARSRSRTHGMSGTKLYHVWMSMKARCSNPKSEYYHVYGGRGIRVCERWQGKDGFQNFLADMGPKPQGHSLDRINNDGPYSPENCRWATAIEQQNNTSNSRWIDLGDRRVTVAQAARLAGLMPGTILYRLDHGWSPSDAVAKPSSRKRA